MDEIGMIVNTQEKWALPEDDFIETMTKNAVNNAHWWENHSKMAPFFSDFIEEEGYDHWQLMFLKRTTLIHEFFEWFVNQLAMNTLDCEGYTYVVIGFIR